MLCWTSISVSYTHLDVYKRQIIDIDIPAGKINVKLSQEEINKRMDAWKAPEPRIKTGYLGRYARIVSSASKGAVLL